MKNFFIFIFVFLILVMPILSFAQTTGGLVPCDNLTPTTLCDFTAFMKLINKIIDFILKDLTIPIAAIMFAYAGILLVTAGGAEAKTKAKTIFTNAVIGLMLVAGCWLIIKTILVIMGYKDIGLFFN